MTFSGCRELSRESGVDLDESYVLDVSARPSTIELRLDLVLLPFHPHYRPPGPDEHACYRRAILQINGIRTLSWTGQGRKPSRDATGEIDFGYIVLLRCDPPSVALEGGFGRIEVECADVKLTLDAVE